MTLKSTLLLIGCCFLSATAISQDLTWAKQLGGPGNSDVNRMCIDNAGNSYVVGKFSSMVDFDPDAGQQNITASASYDLFIEKLSPSGSLLWVKTLNGTNYAYAPSICVDGSGNVLVAASFTGSVDVDPGPGVNSITSAGGTDCYLLKLDNAGNFVWGKQFGGNGNDMLYNIQLDSAGNIYTTGIFEGTSDMDPGSGTFSLSSVAAMDYDVFFQKLDTGGNLTWAKCLNWQGLNDGANMIVNSGGEIYVAHDLFGNVDMDPGPGTFMLSATNGSDGYILKLNTNGDFVWAKQLEGDNSSVKAIALGNNDDICMTGTFSGQVDFDPAVTSWPVMWAYIGSNSFILKLDSSGAFQWVKTLGTDDYMYCNSIDVDSAGGIYTCGYFEGVVDFDPGTSGFVLTSPNSAYHGYYHKLDANGDFQWIRELEAVREVIPKCFALGAPGEIYLSGIMDSTCDFDPGSAAFNLTSVDSLDVFIAKYSVPSTSSSQLNTVRQNDVSIYPNPSDGVIHISSTSAIKTIVVTDILGRETLRIQPDNKSTTITLQQPGLYFVTTYQRKERAVQKVLIQ